MTGEEHPNRVTEEWTYVGRFMTSKNKLGAHWLDANGDDRYFGGAKGNIVGGIFEVVVEYKDGDGVTMYGAPLYVRPSDDAEKVAAWRLADRTAYLADEARKVAARAAKENGDIGEMTLRQVRDQMRSTGFAPRRGALLAAVFAYVEN